MKVTEALKKLESLGTAQNRKVYARHGVGPKMFGVSYADLGKLVREIGADHELALELWASGNHDARVLATMVVDPGRMSARELEGWAEALDNHVLTDAFARVAAKSPAAPALERKWTRSKDEWLGAAGWGIRAQRVESPALSDADLEACLAEIEAKIHGAKNRTRYAMLMALIAVGVRGGELQKKAVAAAKRIGVVEVDHGETGCKTPDAASYIEKTVAYRKKKAGKKKTARKEAQRSTRRARA